MLTKLYRPTLFYHGKMCMALKSTCTVLEFSGSKKKTVKNLGIGANMIKTSSWEVWKSVHWPNKNKGDYLTSYDTYNTKLKFHDFPWNWKTNRKIQGYPANLEF